MPGKPIGQAEAFGEGIDHAPFFADGGVGVQFLPELVEFLALAVGREGAVGFTEGGGSLKQVVHKKGEGGVEGIVQPEHGSGKGGAHLFRKAGLLGLVGHLGDPAELGLFEGEV